MNSFNFLLNIHLFEDFDEKMIGALVASYTSDPKLYDRSSMFQEGYLISKNNFTLISTSPAFQESKSRLNKKYTKHSEELVGIFYEHFLVSSWEEYSRISIKEFKNNFECLIKKNTKALPYTINKLLLTLCKSNWPYTINSIHGIHQYMLALTKKSNFPAHYQDSITILSNNYPLFRSDFKNCMNILNEDVHSKYEPQTTLR